MIFFTVSFFGHREIEDLRHLDERLSPIIKEIIRLKPQVTFLIGRNGEFDEYAASVIKRVQKDDFNKTGELSLVLPYLVANIEYYEKYYDSVIIPEEICKAHPKVAITLKNRWMIERSDLVIVYVERYRGGAYNAMKYAEKLNKRVINICKSETLELF